MEPNDKNKQEIIGEGINGFVKPEKVEVPVSELNAAKKDKAFLAEVLEDYDIESPEELRDFIDNLAKFKEKTGDADIDSLLEKAALFERYHKQWEKSGKNSEKEDDDDYDMDDPDDVIKKLKKENLELKRSKEKEISERKAAEHSKKAVKRFNDTVESVVEKQAPGMEKSERDFLMAFLGVKNPILDVDLNSQVDIRRTVKSLIKKYENFKDSVVKQYTEGKVKPPPMSPSGDPAPASSDDKKIKNLRDARGLALEYFERRKAESAKA